MNTNLSKRHLKPIFSIKNDSNIDIIEDLHLKEELNQDIPPKIEIKIQIRNPCVGQAFEEVIKNNYIITKQFPSFKDKNALNQNIDSGINNKSNQKIEITKPKQQEKMSEMLFEKFNVEKCHIANSSMLGLFSYGKTSGIAVDSGFNITSTVPLYEGFPLQYASMKINLGGEDLSLKLLELIKNKLDNTYKLIKGRLLADDIKEQKGFISMNNEEEDQGEINYTLPDGKEIKLGNEVFKSNDIMFNPGDNNELMSVSKMVFDSLNLCDDDVKSDINESICLIGGNTLMKNFPEKLKMELSDNKDMGNFNLSYLPERQFSSWVGGSIMSSLDNFKYMWVTKEEFDEKGKTLVAIDSKCF